MKSEIYNVSIHVYIKVLTGEMLRKLWLETMISTMIGVID